MIKICSFFHLPIEEERIGPVYSIANTHPRQIGHVSARISCLMPDWKTVQDFRNHQISEEDFTNAYRTLIVRRWSHVKQWLDQLSLDDEMYLCCWEKEGFCHRYLVAKLVKHFRPDLEVRVT